MPRLAAALVALAWGSVGLQLVLTLKLAVANGQAITDGLVTFFGYFTILTNLLVAVSLTCTHLAADTTAGRLFGRPSVAAALVTSLAFVGLGYHLLLRDAWDPTGLQSLADTLLHYVMPIGFGLHWWFIAPKQGLRWFDPMVWCLYPVAYFAYALARGAWIGSYPYPFIDVSSLGFAAALRNAFGLLVGFLVLGLIAIGCARACSATAVRR